MQRYLNLDFLRIVACFMVVMMHAQPYSNESSSLLLVVTSYATAPCIGLFFMLSGTLRLTHTIKDYKSYFIGILRKIVLPVFFWNTLYGVFYTFIYHQSWTSFHTYSFIFRLNNPALWFIFPLLGLYLLVPILQSWLQNSTKKQQHFYIIVWLITLILPWFNRFLPIEYGSGSMFNYFSGYVGYFLLGYHLRHHASKFSRYSIYLFIFAWLVPIVVKEMNFELNFYQYFWYLSVFVVAQCVFWMQFSTLSFISKFLNKYQRAVVNISQLTFGVYLIHGIFIFSFRKYVYPLHLDMPFVCLYAITTVFCFGGSLLFAWLLRKNKLTRMMIGA